MSVRQQLRPAADSNRVCQARAPVSQIAFARGDAIGRQKRAAGEPDRPGNDDLGRDTDEHEAAELLDMFLGAGGTLVDTADVYAEGESEKILVVFLWTAIAATPSSSRQKQSHGPIASAGSTPPATIYSTASMGLCADSGWTTSTCGSCTPGTR